MYYFYFWQSSVYLLNLFPYEACLRTAIGIVYYVPLVCSALDLPLQHLHTGRCRKSVITEFLQTGSRAEQQVLIMPKYLLKMTTYKLSHT